LLSAAFAEGRLTRDEHDERQQAVVAAQTFDDLVPLTRDLVALDEHSPTSQPPWSAAPQPLGAGAEPEMLIALFGGTTRKGRWYPRRNLSVLTMFGGTEIDLSEAVVSDNICEINVFCLFGGVEVRVPDGATVRNECVAIFGGADTGKVVPPVPTGPTVVVKGFVGFGGVEVRGPRRKKDK
jgi:hypothetical protein